MRSYEGLFIFSPESGPDQRQKEIKTLDELVKKSGGSITEKNEVGKKILGYKIARQREGYLVTIQFQMDPSKFMDFRRTLELEASFLKFMVNKVEVAAKNRVKKAAKAAKPKPATEQVTAK